MDGRMGGWGVGKEGKKDGREGGRGQGEETLYLFCIQQTAHYVIDKEESSLKAKKYLKVASVKGDLFFPQVLSFLNS